MGGKAAIAVGEGETVCHNVKQQKNPSSSKPLDVFFLVLGMCCPTVYAKLRPPQKGPSRG